MTHIIAVANRVLVKCLLATVVVWGYLTDLAARCQRVNEVVAMVEVLRVSIPAVKLFHTSAMV
jgi:hypothetical protein